MTRRSLLAALPALLLLPALARAAPDFQPLPPEPGEAKSKGLTGRVLRYDGSTNGQMVIAIQNPTNEPLTFDANGLYFVPRVPADRAPQRLGAVGGFDHADSKGKRTRSERLSLAPGETAQLHLDVYCIDSHRSSPSPETPFRIAGERMPRKLTQEIQQATKRAADGNGGYAAPAAKSAVQGEVWKNRDKEWIPLQGEGPQEAAK